MNKYYLILMILFLQACSEKKATPRNFDFTPILKNGTCVHDNLSGLDWEVKTTTPGLHNMENTYSWYAPSEPHNELDYRGLANGGQCQGSACDIFEFVQAVNKEVFCGFSDWRLPSKEEFFSISDLSLITTPPTLDIKSFPNTKTAEYWTGFDYSFQYNAAWAWNFKYGHDRVDWKKNAKFVRLLRGQLNKKKKKND